MRDMWPIALSAALLVAVVGGAVVAQTPSQPASPAPPPPVEPERLIEVDGAVQAIDRQVEWVRVSGGATGRPTTTLQFTDATQVVVEGRPGSLEDVREGDRVKAAYEDRHGIRLAHRVEVLPGR
ncbi:MAG: hypothetical protein ACREMB_16200 [Candidatus Rokuibacteriota bacterium]